MNPVYLFLLALALEASVIVFVITAVWFTFGWFGVLMYAIGSIGANFMFLEARPKLLIIRKRHRKEDGLE